MTITVWQSIPRIVTIGGAKFRVTCEDWRTVPECERAMEMVIETVRSLPSGTDYSHPMALDALADTIMIRLGVPADTPYGCSIIMEPLSVLARDGLPQDFGAGEV